jgi:WD40 repeat protein
VIRILDYRSRQVIKILRGHGGEVISLKFHPDKPHILASASGDKTIRIWNIHGAELDRPISPSGIVNLSENFPQGDADEGTVAVGILAGEQFGHRAEVSALVSIDFTLYSYDWEY